MMRNLKIFKQREMSFINFLWNNLLTNQSKLNKKPIWHCYEVKYCFKNFYTVFRFMWYLFKRSWLFLIIFLYWNFDYSSLLAYKLVL